MATKKVKIEYGSIFDDVKIIGITSSLIDYKIAIALDRTNNMRFNKLPDIADENMVPYSFYFYKFANSETSCDLISLKNKTLGKNWLGNLPITMDYLLIIRGDEATESMAKKISTKMSGYPNITTYLLKSEYNPTMQKITSRIENLILEQAEMHELSYDTPPLKPSNLKKRKIKQVVK